MGSPRISGQPSEASTALLPRESSASPSLRATAKKSCRVAVCCFIVAGALSWAALGASGYNHHDVAIYLADAAILPLALGIIFTLINLQYTTPRNDSAQVQVVDEAPSSGPAINYV